MGIESTSLDKLQQHKVPFVYNFSPSVVPPPLDWHEWIHITGSSASFISSSLPSCCALLKRSLHSLLSGYWFLDDPDDSSSKKWEPPAGLLEFIDKAHSHGKKVVYIGFGSIGT